MGSYLLKTIAGGVLFIFLGTSSFYLLLQQKDGPDENAESTGPPPVKVEVIELTPGDHPVTISGFGEVRFKHQSDIAPEVSGPIISIHPKLELGGHIEKGQILFTIESDFFELKVDELESENEQFRAQLSAIELEQKNKEQELTILIRSEELGKQQLQRSIRLKGEAIGTQSDIDQSEQALILLQQEIQLLKQTMDVYPQRIREIQSTVKSSESRLAYAQKELEKTRVLAPFDCQVTRNDAQIGQYANRGLDLVTLVNHTVLEIPVKLDAFEAQRSLPFNTQSEIPFSKFSFYPLRKTKCVVRWPESGSDEAWTGMLDRVESYDPDTRSVSVVIQVDPTVEQEFGDSAPYPLTRGMFCEVEIQGNPLKSTYKIPESAFSASNTVHIAQDDKLLTKSVEVARRMPGWVFVSEGLSPNDLLITTRLVNPLDSMPLEIITPTGSRKIESGN